MVEVEYKEGAFKITRDFRIENGDSFIVGETDDYWLVISCHTNIVTAAAVVSDEKLIAKAVKESENWIIRRSNV